MVNPCRQSFFIWLSFLLLYTQYSAETERHRIIPQTEPMALLLRLLELIYIYYVQIIKKKEKQSLNNEKNVT